jgi:hypothetical protein
VVLKICTKEEESRKKIVHKVSENPGSTTRLIEKTLELTRLTVISVFKRCNGFLKQEKTNIRQESKFYQSLEVSECR